MIYVLAAAALGLFLAIRTRDQSAPTAPAPAGYAHGSPPVSWRPSVALARLESRRLLLHPAFLFGVLVTPFILWLATGQEADVEWWQADTGIPLGMVPLGWFTIVAANLNALRSKRHGTEELLEAMPVPAIARTAAHSLTALATVPVTLIAVIGWALVVDVRMDALGTPRAAEIAAALFIVAGAVVVGVVVARWLPHPMFGVAAVFVVSIAEGLLGEPANSAAKFLAFLAPHTDAGDPIFDVRHAGWHLVYLAGLTVLVAVAALLRHGWRPPLKGALAGTLVLTGVAGYLQTRPADAGQAAAMIGYLVEAERHQVCEERGRVTYCAYERTRDEIAAWRGPVERTLAAVPPEVADRPLVVQQRFPTVTGNADCAPEDFLDTLPDDVASRLTYEAVFPETDVVHPGVEHFPCSDRSTHGVFLGVQVGSWAVGLPASPWHRDVRCRADGQARSVLALWLGARGTPHGADMLDALLRDPAARSGEHFDFPRETDVGAWDNPPMWGVEWHAQDMAAARRLLELPAGDVESAVATRWSELTDPRTPAGVLLDAVGVDAIPAPMGLRDGTPACP